MRPLKVNLGKLAVVERQIDTAIWLWFNKGDVVSIRTLTGAALGVLDGLYQHRKKGRPFPFSEAPTGMTLKQAIKMLKADENFAKHARHDAEETREYRYDRATAYLFCAVAAYFNLTSEHGRSGLKPLFWTRYGMIHPALYKVPRFAIQTPQERVEVERLQGLSRAEYFNEGGKDFIGSPPSPEWWPDDRHLGIPPG
jgi:hypothetical protein